MDLPSDRGIVRELEEEAEEEIACEGEGKITTGEASMHSDQLDCLPIFEVLYEELELFTGDGDATRKLEFNDSIVTPDEVSGDTVVNSGSYLDLHPECLSVSTKSESEESGVTSPVYHYEEEVDSLSLCSSTSVVDDKDDTSSSENVLLLPCLPLLEIIPAPMQSVSSPSTTSLSTPEQPKGPVTPTGSLKSASAESQGKFRRQNIRSSILKRLTISWKREYDFQLELNKCFAEDEYSRGPEDCQLTGPIAPPLRLLAPSGREDLKQDEVLRRHVLASIIESENSYIDSLFRLVKEYQEPLKKSTPPILSETKIALIFSKIPQILQLHLQLRIALADLLADWKYEKLGVLGNIFHGLFSKPYVSDVYASYVCNFSTALDTVKRASKEKPAFKEFLRSKQELSKDRLNLFGLLVKPVQRFPQFILLLQDLLKHTPACLDERISLQLALTHLEALTDSLNERKREHEQEKSARDVLKWAKIPAAYRASSGGDDVDEIARRVVAEDDFQELELTASGGLVRMKSRRLFLLNDLLICAVPATDRSPSQLIWIANIADVEVIDEKPVKFLGYQISSPSAGTTASSSPNASFNGDTSAKHETNPSDAIAKTFQEMTDLRQDYESFKRISDIVEHLKFDYSDLRLSHVDKILRDIQSTIQVKMEDAARSDNCTFQLVIPGRSKNQRLRVVLQAGKWKQKLTWIMLIHLSKLVYDKRLNPSWDDPDVKGINSPLFFLQRSLFVQQTAKKTVYKCGCYCFASQKDDPSVSKARAKKSPTKADGLVYLCCSDGSNSKVIILSVEGIRDREQHREPHAMELLSFNISQTDVSCCEWIPGVFEVDPKITANATLLYDSIWIGTEGGAAYIFLASAKVVSLGSVSVGQPVRKIVFNYDKVYVALADSRINVHRRNEDGCWELKPYSVVRCSDSGSDLRCVEVYADKLLCAIDNEIVVIDCTNDSVLSRHRLRKSSECHITRLARCGSGLWVTYEKSCIVSLFHAETFKFLQEVNVSLNINRILAERESERSTGDIFVTSLLAIRGSLWIGTNVGLILTVSLPKLDGVPITLSRPTVSFHAHLESASLLLALQPRTVTRKPPTHLQNRLSTLTHSDSIDSGHHHHPRPFRRATGNQLILRMWLDDSPDISSLYDALMRGSSSSEESINSKDQVRFDARRRRSLPSIPAAIEAESQLSSRPVSFLRNSDLHAVVSRQSSVLRPFSMIHDASSEWPPNPQSPSKLSSQDSFYLDSCSRTTGFSEERAEPSNKPKFVKGVRETAKNTASSWWHSTLLVISAGSGYRNLRGNGATDQDASHLCLLGWEMRV